MFSTWCRDLEQGGPDAVLTLCLQKSCAGGVGLSDVQFMYPTRPDVAVLRGISLTALQGKRLALVGTSGCGKSTIIQLIERFYDPLDGAVVSTSNLF